MKIDNFVFDDAALSATDVANLNPAKIGAPGNDLIVGYSASETLLRAKWPRSGTYLVPRNFPALSANQLTH